MFNLLTNEPPLIKDIGLLTNFADLGLKVLLPLVIILLISGYIGMERQNVGKAAGISSHVLVALSATGVAILNRLLYDYDLGLALQGVGSRPESQRLIAQVIAGVGFIGAGVILKDKSNIIIGLTTASTIWAVAIVGLILGSGYIITGLILGLIIIVFLTVRDLSRNINPFVRQSKLKQDPHEVEKHDS